MHVLGSTFLCTASSEESHEFAHANFRENCAKLRSLLPSLSASSTILRRTLPTTIMGYTKIMDNPPIIGESLTSLSSCSKIPQLMLSSLQVSLEDPVSTS
jgi:hypothetical protein